MRLIAPIIGDERFKRLMIYADGDGVYLFMYQKMEKLDG